VILTESGYVVGFDDSWIGGFSDLPVLSEVGSRFFEPHLPPQGAIGQTAPFRPRSSVRRLTEGNGNQDDFDQTFEVVSQGLHHRLKLILDRSAIACPLVQPGEDPLKRHAHRA